MEVSFSPLYGVNRCMGAEVPKTAVRCFTILLSKCTVRSYPAGLLNVATYTLPWAVQLRSSYDTISTMGGFLESDLVVLSKTLNQDLSDYTRPDVELVASPCNSVVAPATQLTCLQLPTHDTLTRSGDSGDHIQRGISRILRPRAYLDLLTFRKPSPPDFMGVISGTGRGALALFFASHE
jgi:hypothetical protein